MSWAIGYENGRDIGYGVPAVCDKPGCNAQIDRGISYCCGDYATDYGCGLYFCTAHLAHRIPRGSDMVVQICPRCIRYRPPYDPKPDVADWIRHKLTHESWSQWRQENPDEVENMKKMLATLPAGLLH